MVPLSPNELRAILLKLFVKPYGSNTKLANTLNISKVTVARWLYKSKIGNVESLLVRLLVILKREGKEKYLEEAKRPFDDISR